MNNRFGFKDLVVCTMLAVLLVTVWLTMKQYDRQWDELKSIRQQMVQQTQELTRIRRMLAEGVQFSSKSSPRGGTDTDLGDPFEGIKKAQANPDYARGDWLVEAFGVNPPKLTPLLSSDVYASIMQARVIESLAMRDPSTLQWRPLLARSWEVTDNVAEYERFVEERRDQGASDEQIREDPDLPDPVVVTFQLRRGIAFSDGEPVKPEDVVFTFNWIMNDKVDAPRARAYYQKIKSVDQTGDWDVTFRFREPYFEAFELAATMSILPSHFYGTYEPEQFNKEPGLLMGTGPYRMKDPVTWRPQDPLVLYRNERYWGEPGPFDRLVYRVIENEAAELTAFRNGEIDMYGAEPEQYQGMLDDGELMARVRNYVVEHLRAGYVYIAWNQKRRGEPTAFADPRVRRAMTMLADRQGVCDKIFLGYGKVATGPFHFLGQQADPSVEPWPFDVAQARQLLREAGYEDRDSNGVLESESGQELRITLRYPSGGETYKRVLLFLKDSFARGGVVLEPEPTDWPLLIQKLDTRDFQAITLGWSGGIETDIFQMFHSSQTVEKADNFMNYANPELDETIDKARKSLDEPKRMELWRRCHRILHEDQPYTFLFRRKGLLFIDKRIHNVHETKVGFNYVSGWVMPIEWYVPTPLQIYTD